MRTLIMTALAAAVVSVTSIGPASAFTSTGVIERVNTVSGTVTIRNGDAYKLPAGTDLSAFQAGERVNVIWETQNPNTVKKSSSSEATLQLLQADGIEHAG